MAPKKTWLCFQAVLSLNKKNGGPTINVFYCVSARKRKKLRSIKGQDKYTTSTCYLRAKKKPTLRANEGDCVNWIVAIQQSECGNASSLASWLSGCLSGSRLTVSFSTAG